eukprot:scaffold431_cov334-Pavlova_lutheri.AAC.91
MDEKVGFVGPRWVRWKGREEQPRRTWERRDGSEPHGVEDERECQEGIRREKRDASRPPSTTFARGNKTKCIRGPKRKGRGGTEMKRSAPAFWTKRSYAMREGNARDRR